MPPVSGEKEYASSDIVRKPKNLNVDLSEQVIKHFDDKYDNYQLSKYNRSNSSIAGSDSVSGCSSVDTSELTEEERLKIDICFRGLKTQVYVCNSLTNLYYGETVHEGDWELRYTGVPVVILDSGETRSRDKRRIRIILAERGTCFTLWQDTIDNLSAYKVSAEAFHTMYLSSDHRKIIGLSFDCVEAANELWLHIDRLTSCPENISLSGPCSRNKKVKKQNYPPLPEKSNISRPCCFQHITNIHLKDRARYFSLQTLLPDLPHITSRQDEHSESTRT